MEELERRSQRRQLLGRSRRPAGRSLPVFHVLRPPIWRNLERCRAIAIASSRDSCEGRNRYGRVGGGYQGGVARRQRPVGRETAPRDSSHGPRAGSRRSPTAVRDCYRLMAAGEHETIDATDEVIVRFGDSLACSFSINGAVARHEGKAGEPVTLHITRQNYQDFLNRRTPRRIRASSTRPVTSARPSAGCRTARRPAAPSPPGPGRTAEPDKIRDHATSGRLPPRRPAVTGRPRGCDIDGRADFRGSH